MMPVPAAASRSLYLGTRSPVSTGIERLILGKAAFGVDYMHGVGD